MGRAERTGWVDKAERSEGGRVAVTRSRWAEAGIRERNWVVSDMKSGPVYQFCNPIAPS